MKDYECNALCMENENKTITLAKKEEDTSHHQTSNSITTDYNQIINIMSDKYWIAPSLNKAVIQVESNWNSKAVSHAGAMGLMQLMPTTAKDMNIRNPFNPEDNIDGGAQTSNSITSAYNRIINRKSDKYGIEPSLIKAVIQVESSWNSKAVSHAGAMGLMQIMPTTAKDMNIRNPFNPEDNIDGGARYLRYLLDKFNGNLIHAIAAYNAGPTRVARHRGIPPIKETRQYVKRVLSLYNNEKTIHTVLPLKSEI
jgi:soluble lytic murein transglycosylase-like protein